MSTSRKNKESGLFDAEFRLRKLDAMGDPLTKLTKGINWERFRPLLDKGFQNTEPAKGPGGRPPFDRAARSGPRAAAARRSAVYRNLEFPGEAFEI